MAAPGERRAVGVNGSTPRSEGLRRRPWGAGTKVEGLRATLLQATLLQAAASAGAPRAGHAARPSSGPPRCALPLRCGEARGEVAGSGGLATFTDSPAAPLPPPPPPPRGVARAARGGLLSGAPRRAAKARCSSVCV